MTKIAKLYARAVARGGLRFTELEKLVFAFGFEFDRQRGSHRVYRRPDVPEGLIFQPEGKAAKPYQVEQFLAIVGEHGLTLEDTE